MPYHDFENNYPLTVGELTNQTCTDLFVSDKTDSDNNPISNITSSWEYQPYSWTIVLGDQKKNEDVKSYTFSHPSCEAKIEYAGEPKEFIPVSILYNDPVTVVKWADGTTTRVRCGEGEQFSRYGGFAAALCKKVFGSTSRVQSIIDGADVTLKELQAAEEKERERQERQEAERRRQAKKLRRAVRRERKRREFQRQVEAALKDEGRAALD